MLEFKICLTALECKVLREVVMTEVRSIGDGKYEVRAEEYLFDNIEFYSQDTYFEQTAHAVRFVERNWDAINDLVVLEEGSIEEFLFPVTRSFCSKEYIMDILNDTGMGQHNKLMRILGEEVVRRCLININVRKEHNDKKGNVVGVS